MSRLSSNSINRLETCSLSSIELAFKPGSGFAILCDVRPGSSGTGSAPLCDGEGFTKFYASKVYAVRAIQRVRDVSSDALAVRHDYFGGAA